MVYKDAWVASIPIQPVSSLVECTRSHNWFWSESPSSYIRAAQFSLSVRPKRGSLESCGRKIVRTPWTFLFIKLARTSSFPPDKGRATLESSRIISSQSCFAQLYALEFLMKLL